MSGPVDASGVKQDAQSVVGEGTEAVAGLRAYSAGNKTLKAWFGYYNNKVIDHYTRAVIAVHVHQADTNEAALYPTMYARARTSIGADPQRVAGDRGVATAAPTDAPTAPLPCIHPPGPHGPMWDELGQPLCQHCGGATAHKGFTRGRGPGRLAYQCLLPQTHRHLLATTPRHRRPVIEWTWVHVRRGWAARPRIAGRARRPTTKRLTDRLTAQTN